MSLTTAVLGPARAGSAARPLVTFYDDATGERIELSAVTTVNWAAKAATCCATNATSNSPLESDS